MPKMTCIALNVGYRRRSLNNRRGFVHTILSRQSLQSLTSTGSRSRCSNGTTFGWHHIRRTDSRCCRVPPVWWRKRNTVPSRYRSVRPSSGVRACTARINHVIVRPVTVTAASRIVEVVLWCCEQRQTVLKVRCYQNFYAEKTYTTQFHRRQS